MRALLLLVILSAAAAHPAEGDREQTEAALARITDRLNDLSVWLGGAERKRAQWQREIQTSDREVARLAREVDSAAAALTGVRRELEALRAEQSELEAQRARQARHIGDHLTSAWRMSGDDFVKLLLNQQSPDTLDRMVRYHRYFTAARLETLEAYRQTLTRLDDNRARLEARAADAEARQRTLEKERQALLGKRQERRSLLARLASETEDKEAERRRLIEDQERLEALLAELKRRAQSLDGRAFAQRKGSLPWPLNGRVVNAFGQPRAQGQLVWHGLLVAADEGEPISAVYRGRVVFADWLRGFGLLTIVDHGSGYMTLYGHADSLLKSVGDWVESGESIARAGRSGGMATSGLYFEVRHEGQATDPIVWLAKRQGT
ncbi:MAG: peptidoglycan DD-metalloendopeptidase family protein [Pseudomonadales bacterium]